MIRLAGGAGGGSAGPSTVVTQLKGSGAGNYTTVSLIPIPVDAVNLAVALTTPATQRIVISAAGTIVPGGAGINVGVGIAKDGALVANVQAGNAGGDDFYPFGLIYSELGDAVSHTWALYWFVTGAVGFLLNDSAAETEFMTIMQIAAT